MVVEILVGQGCSAEQITDAFRELKINGRCRAFSSFRWDINRKSILAFMERENYHKAFKLTADSEKELFPMETVTKEKDIFYTKGKIFVRFKNINGSWGEWINACILNLQCPN